jgi:DNA-directed RNA polymerase subunit RPC12/RpoP
MSKLYKCGRCGREFEEDEIRYISEFRGECWGVPSHEEIGVCPYCGDDDIEEVE